MMVKAKTRMSPDQKIQPDKSSKPASQVKLQTSLHPSLRGVRAVLFDVGGTLVHPDWERLARLASEGTGREFLAGDLGRKFKEMMCAVERARP
jgi:hypothetical protein